MAFNNPTIVALLLCSSLISLLVLPAAGQTSTCSCPSGFSCCRDTTNGAMCYRPSEYTCISNTLCQVGNKLCGTRCYDPIRYSCYDNTRLCQVTEGICKNSVTGDSQCYSKSLYQCFNGNTLCAISESLCGTRCYSLSSYNCVNGTLCAASEGYCLVNGSPQCYNKTTHKCLNNQYLCGALEESCNGVCYSASVHRCVNGNLCPADSTTCNGQPTSCFGKSTQDPLVCSGRGQCVSQDICRCNSGFSGSDCSTTAGPISCNGISHDSNTVCSSQGTCVANNTCVCNAGRTGADCSQIACLPGTSGPNCDQFSCFGVDKSSSSVCSGHGSCTRPDTCSCQSNYYGSQCSQFYNNSTTKPCLFLIGQNEVDEYEAYATAFGKKPAGGSFYSNIFEAGLGPNMISYLNHMSRNYPGSKHLFGLDAKGMFTILYGNYDTNKNTVKMFQDILEGKTDNNIKTFANTLKGYYNLTFMMRIDYEVSGNLHANTNPNAWDVATQDPQFYKKAFCKVANMFREIGATNVEFVYHPNRGDHLKLYPDASCVDWIGFSVFNHDVVEALYNGETYFWNNQTGTIDSNLKAGFEWARTTGKKLMIAESAVQRPNSKDLALLQRYFDRLMKVINDFQVDAWAYINSDWISKGWPAEWDDSRIEQKPDSFKQWWRTNVVNNPKFIYYN